MRCTRSLSIRVVLCFCGLIAPAVEVLGSEIPTAKPADVQMSARALSKVQPVLQKAVDEERYPGAVVAVARHGKRVYLESVGFQDIESKTPMREDTIFRIYSMTKTVTSVAVLALVEDGKIDLDAPVSTYIPEFADLSVFVKEGDDGVETTPTKRAITTRDLLRHTAGLTYGIFGNTYVDRQYNLVGILNRGTTKDMIGKLQKIPLLYQPGESWVYSVASDVCGYLVEVVSEQSLDEFMQKRIFEPLDMKDTGFTIAESKLDRLATNYGPKGVGRGLRPIQYGAKSSYLKKPELLSGGGGLLSTTRDFLRFAQMLLNGGTLNDVRVLRPETVAAMTSNQLTGPAYPIRFGVPYKGVGFGLGVSVVVDGGSAGSPVREYGWAGAASTSYSVSPDDALVIVVMTQYMPFSLELEQAVSPLIYDAIDQPREATRL